MLPAIRTEIRARRHENIRVLQHLDTKGHTVLVQVPYMAIEIEGPVGCGKPIETELRKTLEQDVTIALIAQNMVIEGVRYVNAPLGYPRERERWGREGIRLRLLVDDADNISAETIAAAKLTDDRSNRASRRTTRI